MRKKISVIFGTRPEAIKLAPVILALKADPTFDCHVCVTAQHRQMLDQVMDIFSIEPDCDLDLMQPDQTLAGLTARAIEGLDRYLAREKPDAVLVQGDTTTVFCGALAAFYHRIPVGHVEAGLRTGNLDSPWPEEANRVLTSRLARWHFAPTAVSRQNLLTENVPEAAIHVTGNTGIDALFLAQERLQTIDLGISGLPEFLQPRSLVGEPRMVLVTGHRRENFGRGFESICQAITLLAQRYPQVHFVYPVHLNPRVREPVERILGRLETSNVHLIEPLDYLPFVGLMGRADIVLTDSGGVQEEAPSLGKPVLVMRDTTERPEAVAAGTVKLVGTSIEKIVANVSSLLDSDTAYKAMAKAVNPYGDGQSAPRILDILKQSNV
ncbi:MAG: UDP-N-acetylglucosamine 2-epimerase (non-hydrolyzing) [Desulfuromonadales bacterium]|nr:UDP-N-acetylglucosamine 2-epimerase (non-hydrolyzing) [Desulfuromonadales bacterium]